MPCQPDDWCHWVHDRFAGTVVNTHVRGLYTAGDGGIVLTGSLVSLSCSYSSDASTTGRRLSEEGRTGLDPAASPKGSTRRRLALPCPPHGPAHQDWCTAKAKTEAWLHVYDERAAYPQGSNCAWHPFDIQAMMRQQAYMGGYIKDGRLQSYNELVIDTAPYAHALPASLAAFFIQPASSVEQRHLARDQHSAFLQEYGRSAAQVPLLMYDPEAKQAFSCMRCKD